MGGGRPQAATFPFAAAERAAADGGGRAKTLGCPVPLPRNPRNPHRSPALGGSCPRAPVSPQQPCPQAGLRESPLRRERHPHPLIHTPKPPGVHESPPPSTQGQTSQLFARPRSAPRSPHAKLIKIGSSQSPGAHSEPHAPPHHSPPSEGGWKRRANRPTPTTRPGIPERRGQASGRRRGRTASSGDGSRPAGSRGGGAPAPATGLHSPQRCRTGSPQPSSATGPPAAPAASSPPAHRLHRLLPPHPPRGRPDSVAARAPRQRRRLPWKGLGVDTDPRTPRAQLETPARQARASRCCPAPGLAPFFLSSFRRGDYSSAPRAGSRARSRQNSSRRALPTSAHNMAPKRYLSLTAGLSRRRHRARALGGGACEDTPPAARLGSALLPRPSPSLSLWASPTFRKGEPRRFWGRWREARGKKS